MKLYEVNRIPPNLGKQTNVVDGYIKHWLRVYGVAPSQYHIHQDGTVDILTDINFQGHDNPENGELPIRFGVVKGNFICCDMGLKTLKGCPRRVEGHFMCYRNFITSLEGCPNYVERDFNCSESLSLTSFHNIHKQISFIGGSLDHSGCDNLTEAYLGVLLIKGLRKIITNYSWASDSPAFQIILKYLPTHDIIGCQQELIDAGFEKLARL